MINALLARLFMTAKKNNKLNFDLLITQAADVFHALSHPVRLSICLELDESEKSVNQLCESLNQPQHTISQQLAILRKQEVVNSRKESRQVFYEIADPRVIKILNCVKNEALARDAGEVYKSERPVKSDLGQADEAGRFSRVF